MNAKEARKLGFADEVLFAGGENPLPEEDDTIEMLFPARLSQIHCSRLIPKKKPEADKHMVPLSILRSAFRFSHIKGGFFYDSDYGTYGQRAKAWEAAKSFLNTHSQNGGMVSQRMPRPTTRWKRKSQTLHDIERLQRQEEIDKMLSAPTSAPAYRQTRREE